MNIYIDKSTENLVDEFIELDKVKICEDYSQWEVARQRKEEVMRLLGMQIVFATLGTRKAEA